MAPKATAKGKAKSKAKAKAKSEPAQKKQKLEDAEEAKLAMVLACHGMSSMQFHSQAKRMRQLLKYRSSEECQKAHISLYMQAFREAINIYIYVYTS